MAPSQCERAVQALLLSPSAPPSSKQLLWRAKANSGFFGSSVLLFTAPGATIGSYTHSLGHVVLCARPLQQG